MTFNQFGYSKERRQFGRQCLFSDRNELLLSIPQRADLRSHYILRNPVSRGTQLSDQQGLSSALTENVTLASHGIKHQEGGWPKDVNILDEEQTLRYRKKIEREDAWTKEVIALSSAATDCILQNSAVNIYEDFFSEISEMEIRYTFASRPINIYHDPLIPYRPIAHLDWCPGNVHHILSVHTNLDYYPTTNEPNECFIWDIENPLKTVVSLNGPTWIRKANFCPRDETLIAGGYTNGKVGLWDARTGGKPVAICSLEAGHREAVSALCWVHSKSNTEFYTGSVDGSILYWDGRNLKNWYMEFLLDPKKTDKQSRSRAHGCTVLEFEYTIPIRYIVGDDMGHVYIGNRKGMTPMETLILNYKLFSGPIRTIERNPFFVKNFLIVGDWCAKIWSEECKDFPATLFVKKGVQFMCGSWSKSRCSLFATGDSKGVVDFWDLLLDQTDPVFSLNLNYAVTSIRFRRDGMFAAVSLANGDFYLLQLEEPLRHSGPKEKALLSSLFERETYRSKVLQDRVEEIKLKAALAALEEKKYLENDEFGGMWEEGEEEGGTEAIKRSQEQEEINEEEDEELDPDPEFTEIRNSFLQIVNQINDKWKEKKFISEHSPFESETNELKSYSSSISDFGNSKLAE